MPTSDDAVRLAANPAAPAVGRRVRLTVLDPPVGATHWRWYLDGHRRRPGPSELRPELSLVFHSPGVHSATARFTAAGRSGLAAISVRVLPGGRPMSMTEPEVRHAHRDGAMTRMGRASVPVARRTAHAAGDPGVTIVDFRFSPATITVHVGDTVTWTNNGSMPHSATARDGSFDTGILQRGHDASHTFTKAGTFAYFCQVHPFMHGTVVVLAAAPTGTSKSATSSPSSPSSTTGGTSTSQAPAATTTPATTTPAPPSTTTPPATTTPATSGSMLPMTGLNVFASVLAALALLGAGLGLRRMCRIETRHPRRRRRST
ncbi:MAG: cupredoxin family copper-binding protein [Solirubrobacteraceae bacterium]